MRTMNVTHARKTLDRLIDEVCETHLPITITGRQRSAVLVSEEDWKGAQETLYLSAIPGMADSIREGLATPVEECDATLGLEPHGGGRTVERGMIDG